MAHPHGDGAGRRGPGAGPGRRRRGRTPRRARPARAARGRLRRRGPLRVLRRGLPVVSRTARGTRSAGAGQQRAGGQPLRRPDRGPRTRRGAGLAPVGTDRCRVRRSPLRAVVPVDPADPPRRVAPRGHATALTTSPEADAGPPVASAGLHAKALAASLGVDAGPLAASLGLHAARAIAAPPGAHPRVLTASPGAQAGTLAASPGSHARAPAASPAGLAADPRGPRLRRR